MHTRRFAALVAFAAALVGAMAHARPPERVQMQLPAAGLRFATARPGHNDGQLVIGQVDASGLSILADVAITDIRALLWLDAERLLVLQGSFIGESPFVHHFVNGRPTGPPVEASAAAWGLVAPDETLGSHFELGRDRKGRAWLVQCLDFTDHAAPRCRQWISLPIDPATGTFGPPVRRLPPGFRAADPLNGLIDPTRAPRVAAPRGYSLRFHTDPEMHNQGVTGDRKGAPVFTCSGPDGTATWPGPGISDWVLQPRPRSFRWLMQEPPVYLVAGPTTNPIGEHSYGHVVFRGCSPEALDGFAMTRTHVWFELAYERTANGYDGPVCVVHAGPDKLGTVGGSLERLVIAPSPR